MEGLPGGLYEQLITSGLDDQLGDVSPELVDRGPLDPADAYEVLTAHLARLARRALAAVPGDDAATVAKQVEIANEIAAAILAVAPSDSTEELVHESGELLREILERSGLPGRPVATRRPEVPLIVQCATRQRPRPAAHRFRGATRVGVADRVDLLCALVKWHGLRVLEEQLEALMHRGAQMRVITTTYIGATERRALDRLVELGAEVKVSYETRMTRLHAKAWLFYRNSGFSTAYVGSSNLSKSALLDGLEWNVRLSAVEQGHLLDTFQATFDQYWEDPAFEPYDPTDPQQRERLDEALRAEGAHPIDLPIQITTMEVRPWGYQREILRRTHR